MGIWVYPYTVTPVELLVHPFGMDPISAAIIIIITGNRYSMLVDNMEWTVTLFTGPEVFAGLGGWAYCWTNDVGLGVGCYCPLHRLLKCQDGWLALLLALPMAR